MGMLQPTNNAWGAFMIMLLIKKCDDPLMWYSDLIGQHVEYCGMWTEGYKSREPAGYLNIVKFEDAEFIAIEDESSHETP
jgi:hypothetical protein